MKFPEKYRTRNRLFQTNVGEDGAFIIPHYKVANYFFFCIASKGGGWDHVSVSIKSDVRKVDRCPTWEEMCFLKDLFFDKDKVVMQLHPAENDYVNNHPHCLHLWRPQNAVIPTPDPIMVGFADKKPEDFTFNKK